jgi:hypothetical protein
VPRAEDGRLIAGALEIVPDQFGNIRAVFDDLDHGHGREWYREHRAALSVARALRVRIDKRMGVGPHAN